MEFLLGLAAGFWFWPILGIIFLLLLAEDKWGWSTAVLLAGACWWGYGAKPEVSLGQFLWYVVTYVLIGLVFTFVKWWFYVRKSGRAFNEAWALNNVPGGKGRGRLEFAMAMSDTDKYRLITVKDAGTRWTTTYHKGRMTGRITLWTAYWPWYAILILLEDFLKEMIDWFLTVFGTLYRNIANSAYNAG